MALVCCLLLQPASRFQVLLAPVLLLPYFWELQFHFFDNICMQCLVLQTPPLFAELEGQVSRCDFPLADWMLLYGPQVVRAPQGGLADSAFAPSNSVSRGSMQCSVNTTLYGLTSVLTALSFPKKHSISKKLTVAGVELASLVWLHFYPSTVTSDPSLISVSVDIAYIAA